MSSSVNRPQLPGEEVPESFIPRLLIHASSPALRSPSNYTLPHGHLWEFPYTAASLETDWWAIYLAMARESTLLLRFTDYLSLDLIKSIVKTRGDCSTDLSWQNQMKYINNRTMHLCCRGSRGILRFVGQTHALMSLYFLIPSSDSILGKVLK